MTTKTFMAARAELLAHLRAIGWAVSGPLKVPHATSPDGSTRLWFKTQAVYLSTGNSHTLGDARSLWVDIRKVSPVAVVTIATTRHDAEAEDARRVG